MTVCSRYGSRTSWTIPERFARIAAPFSHPKQQESPLQSPIPVVKGDLGEDFLLPPALCSPRQFHPSPVSELDMLSYLTGDKPNAFPRHSCSNWSVWVVTPPTVSLCLTQSGIFSVLWCLPGVPVWLQSSRLSLLSWAKASCEGTACGEQSMPVPGPTSLSRPHIHWGSFLPQIFHLLHLLLFISWGRKTNTWHPQRRCK